MQIDDIAAYMAHLGAAARAAATTMAAASTAAKDNALRALARRLRDTTTGLVDRWRLHGVQLLALELTEAGWPRHPLMLPNDCTLRPVTWKERARCFCWSL